MELNSNDKGVIFIWKIHNFSCCVQKTGEFLRSPKFFVHNCFCNLDLFPRGTEDSTNSIGIRFWKEKAEHHIKLNMIYFVLTDEGAFKNCGIYTCPFPAYCPTHNPVNLNVSAIHERVVKHNSDDTFTVKCKITKVDDKLIEYQKTYYAYTLIGIKKTIYNCHISTLRTKRFLPEKPNLFEDPSFTINACSLKKKSDDETFEVAIKRINTKEVYSSCTMHILVLNKVLQSTRNEHWFQKSELEQTWNVSFTPTRKLLSYPQQDLFLRFEFIVSKGVESSGLETLEYETIVEPSITENSPVISSKTTTEDSWKDNLQRFYSEGTFSDIIIRTPTKDFPVHKAILCSQSTVFTAMFERDMKENQTGIIDIDDLKDETISKMLLYIYGGSVDNLDWSLALELYFAADKYRIEPLGEKCSDFLKENLSSANVCECLMLADLHQDQQLKSVAQEFFLEHSTDIIISEEWKELMKENVSLAAETMHLSLMKLKTT